MVTPPHRHRSGLSSNYWAVNRSSSIGCSHCRHGHTGRAGHAGYATYLQYPSSPWTINYCTHCSSCSYGARRYSHRCSYRWSGLAFRTSLKRALKTGFSGTCRGCTFGASRSSSRLTRRLANHAHFYYDAGAGTRTSYTRYWRWNRYATRTFHWNAHQSTHWSRRRLSRAYTCPNTYLTALSKF